MEIILYLSFCQCVPGAHQVSGFFNLWFLTTSFWTAVTFNATERTSVLLEDDCNQIGCCDWGYILKVSTVRYSLSLFVCLFVPLLSIWTAQPINMLQTNVAPTHGAFFSKHYSSSLFAPPLHYGNAKNVNVLLNVPPMYNTQTNIYYISLITGDLMLTSILSNNKNGNMLLKYLYSTILTVITNLCSNLSKSN